MQKRISFIHAADLHLDSPFKGLSDVGETLFQEIRQSTFTALHNLVESAIKKQVDFVLLVGDLFDNEKQSLKAQINLRNAFQELQRHQIEVYLSYGNHDYLEGNIYPITFPENVHFFDDEEVRSFVYEKDEYPLAKIYGFSYERRSVLEKKVDKYIKIDNHIPFHIAMLHGSIETNTEHDTYAPFKLNDLVEKEFDYWALGHIHKREILKENPYIIYPGNIQGRNRKETGAKGCYYVEMTETKHTVQFIPLHAIEYNDIVIDITDCDTIHQVEEVMTNQMKKLNPTVPQLLDVTFRTNKQMILEWKNDNLLQEIIEIVNESFIHQKNWIYIFRYSIENSNPLNVKGEHFLGELTMKLADFKPSDFLGELYQHKDARRYMEVLSQDEEERIKEEAYELVIHELMKE